MKFGIHVDRVEAVEKKAVWGLKFNWSDDRYVRVDRAVEAINKLRGE